MTTFILNSLLAELEARVAQLLGKPSALFVASGTMANLIAGSFALFEIICNSLEIN